MSRFNTQEFRFDSYHRNFTGFNFFSFFSLNFFLRCLASSAARSLFLSMRHCSAEDLLRDPTMRDCIDSTEPSREKKIPSLKLTARPCTGRNPEGHFIIFQPLIFRGDLLVSGSVSSWQQCSVNGYLVA